MDGDIKEYILCKEYFYWQKSQFSDVQKTLHQSKSVKELFSCEDNDIADYSCRKCDFTTRYFIIMKHHFNVHHSNNIEEYVIRSYRCRFCAFQAYSLLTLLQHLKNTCTHLEFFESILAKCASLPDSSSRSKKRSKANSLSWFYCDHCKYRTKTQYYLYQHSLSQHASEFEDKWLKCDHCDFTTKWYNTLRIHHKHLHAKDFKFHQCGKCQFKTKDKKSLSRHILFKHASDAEIKWFQCGYCDYKAKANASLKQHVLARHTAPDKIEWVECVQCNFKSSCKRYLQQHVRNIHVRRQISYVNK